MMTQRGRVGRPRAASKADVEETALALMLERGYESVSVEDIAAASGISRTTYFRYFGSKPGVVWLSFDDTIERLDRALAEYSGSDALGAVRGAVVGSTRAAVFDSDVWLERFRLLDTSPELQAGTYLHWEAWKRPVAAFVAARTAMEPNDRVPMVVAATCQAVFVSALRDWRNSDDKRHDLLARLDDGLIEMLALLEGVVSSAGSPRADVRRTDLAIDEG
jgi:AcrR family transcriptional regulator